MFEYKASFDVYEDDYNDGELGHCNYFTVEKIYNELNWENIEKFIEKECCYTFKRDNFDLDEDRIYTSFLVDDDNIEASRKEINLWRNGKKTLYSSNCTITFKKLSDVGNLENILN